MYWNSTNIWAKCWCLRSHNHGAESTGKGSESILPCEPKQSSRGSLQLWVGSATNGSVPQVSISSVGPSNSRGIQSVELCKVWSTMDFCFRCWKNGIFNALKRDDACPPICLIFSCWEGGLLWPTLYGDYPKLFVDFKCIMVSHISTCHPCSINNFYLKCLCYGCFSLHVHIQLTLICMSSIHAIWIYSSHLLHLFFYTQTKFKYTWVEQTLNLA